MPSDFQVPADQHPIFSRHAVAAYFVLTLALSWLGVLAVSAPHLYHHLVFSVGTGGDEWLAQELLLSLETFSTPSNPLARLP